MAEGSRGGISISKIKKLDLKPDWRQWIRDIDAWLLENEYDDDEPDEPANVGTRAAAAPGGIGAQYYISLDKWRKSQKKAYNGIIFAYRTRAYRICETSGT